VLIGLESELERRLSYDEIAMTLVGREMP